MVIKTVQMGVPILISRSGFTSWGVRLAQQAGLTMVGRAKRQRTSPRPAVRAERLVFDVIVRAGEDPRLPARARAPMRRFDDPCYDRARAVRAGDVRPDALGALGAGAAQRAAPDLPGTARNWPNIWWRAPDWIRVKVERTQSMGDHYDGQARAIRLSPQHFDGRSVAAAAVAAHEFGHALQQEVGVPTRCARSRRGRRSA